MQRLADNLFHLDASETSLERAGFTLLEAFLVLSAITFAWAWALDIRGLPGVASPLGIAKYLDISFIFADGVSILLAAVATASLVLAGVGVKRAAFYTLAVLILHLLYVGRFSLGAVGHGSHMTGMGVLCLAVASIGFHDPVVRRRIATGCIIFFIGLGYTVAGWTKLIGTGANWPDGHHLQMWIAERGVDVLSMHGVFEPNVLQQLALTSSTVGTAFLLTGLLTELLAFLIWFRSTRILIMVALIGMHIGVALTMNILFGAYILQLAILMIACARVTDSRKTDRLVMLRPAAPI
jgi:hypothetical protein